MWTWFLYPGIFHRSRSFPSSTSVCYVSCILLVQLNKQQATSNLSTTNNKATPWWNILSPPLWCLHRHRKPLRRSNSSRPDADRTPRSYRRPCLIPIPEPSTCSARSSSSTHWSWVKPTSHWYPGSVNPNWSTDARPCWQSLVSWSKTWCDCPETPTRLKRSPKRSTHTTLWWPWGPHHPWDNWSYGSVYGISSLPAQPRMPHTRVCVHQVVSHESWCMIWMEVFGWCCCCFIGVFDSLFVCLMCHVWLILYLYLSFYGCSLFLSKHICILDYGFEDFLSRKPMKEERKSYLIDSELLNGRLAMIAVGGIATQSIITGHGAPWI